MSLKRLFLEHPQSVGETYTEHMQVALSFALPLTKAAAAAYVHAVLPFLCVRTASTTVKELYGRMTNRVPRGHADTAPATRDPMLGWDPVI